MKTYISTLLIVVLGTYQTDATAGWSNTLDSATHVECAASGTRVSYTATAFGSGQVTYSLQSESPICCMFSIDPTTGILTSASTAFNAASVSVFTLIIRAFDLVDGTVADLTLTVTIIAFDQCVSTLFEGVTLVIAGGESGPTTLMEVMTSDTVSYISIISGNNDGMFSLTQEGELIVAIRRRMPATIGTNYRLLIIAVESGSSVRTGTLTVSVCVKECPSTDGSSSMFATSPNQLLLMKTLVLLGLLLQGVAA